MGKSGGKNKKFLNNIDMQYSKPYVDKSIKPKYMSQSN